MDNSLIYYQEVDNQEEQKWVGAVIALVGTVVGGVMSYDQQEKAKKLQEEQIRAGQAAAKKARELEELRQKFEREKMEMERVKEEQNRLKKEENKKKIIGYSVVGGAILMVVIIIIILSTTK